MRINKRVKTSLKTNKIHLFINLICFIVALSILCSCGDNDKNSSAENVFAETSDIFSSESENNSINESVDSTCSEDASCSEENSEPSSKEALTPEQKLDIALENTFTSQRTIYKMVAALSFGDATSSLDCFYQSNDSYISSASSATVNGSQILQRNDFYYNGFAYVDDKLLGKSKFRCEKDFVLNYIQNELHYYRLFDCSESLTENQDGNLEYTLTPSILETNTIKFLSDSLSINNLSFINGKCTLYIDSDESIDDEISSIKNIVSGISAKYTLDQNEFDVSITINVSALGEIEEIIPENSDYTDYSDENVFNLSKSIFNLANTQAYEISSETRIYKEEKKSKTYADIFTSFSSSFMGEKTALSLNISFKNDSEFIFEKYIHDSEEYSRLYSTSSKIPTYNILPSNTDYSKLDTISEWNPLPFKISDLAEYSITETQLYYIINYSYSNEKSISLIKAYNDYWNSLYPQLDFVSQKDIDTLSDFKASKSTGVITIRKSDYVMVENSFDITITNKSNKSFRIINQTEVLALNSDVSVLIPKK